MDDNTQIHGGLPPDRTAAPGSLHEVLAAHALAARVVEDVMTLHIAMPESVPARGRISILLTEASGVETSLVAELRALLDEELTRDDVESIVAHADRMYDLRPRLGRFVDRLLMAALARRACLA